MFAVLVRNALDGVGEVESNSKDVRGLSGRQRRPWRILGNLQPLGEDLGWITANCDPRLPPPSDVVHLRGVHQLEQSLLEPPLGRGHAASEPPTIRALD